jgi:hypothetical protein
MALTSFQRHVINLIAENRRRSGESYVAGGAALNTLIGAPRLSEDVDIFHDTEEAVHLEFGNDSRVLESAGMSVSIKRQWGTFVEATVAIGDEATDLQWAYDSAFRFFPLVEHSELGLTLHPFDLATNKVLAMVGRALPRDWVDTIECDDRLQPLGYLAWACSGKDPGLNPRFILDQASRSARYTEIELVRVNFEGQRPTAASLSLKWKSILAVARQVVENLPWQEVGKCVLDAGGNLLRLSAIDLAAEVEQGNLRYHEGSLRGAYPKLVG